RLAQIRIGQHLLVKVTVVVEGLGELAVGVREAAAAGWKGRRAAIGDRGRREAGVDRGLKGRALGLVDEVAEVDDRLDLVGGDAVLEGELPGVGATIGLWIGGIVVAAAGAGEPDGDDEEAGGTKEVATKHGPSLSGSGASDCRPRPSRAVSGRPGPCSAKP